MPSANPCPHVRGHFARAGFPWRALSLLALAALPLHAQTLVWQDPGNYDHAGHLAKTPNDPSNVPSLPPGFDAGLAHPTTLKVMVTGLDFLSDGRMVVLHCPMFRKEGIIYLLEGVTGPRENIKATIIKEGIWAGFGLKVLNDEIHYSAQDGIFKLVRKPGAPETWETRPFAKFIIAGMEGGALHGSRYPIFNLAYDRGSFYYANGAYKNFNPVGTNLGYAVKLDIATGAQDIQGRGIRMPNGMAANETGDVFFTDNQGEYRPASPIFHLVKGRHYGMAAMNGVSGNEGGHMTNMLPLPPADSIFPPALWIPHGGISRSLTNMLLLKQTPFAGQFLVGDNAVGIVHRVQLEKVKGEYQGASFQFSGVLEAGIQSFTQGPDGTVYGGALGQPDGPGHNWLGRSEGLMKWKANGAALQAIQRVSSQREGFDVAFTEPLAANAINPDWYWVTSYRYEPTSDYGGPRLDLRKHKITRLQASADRRTVAITVDGLEAKRVYRLVFSPSLKTGAGLSLFTQNAWYTLNRIGEAAPLGTSMAALPRAASHLTGFSLRRTPGFLDVTVELRGEYSITIRDARGAALGSYSGRGPGRRRLALPGNGPMWVTLEAASGRETRMLAPAFH